MKPHSRKHPLTSGLTLLLLLAVTLCPSWSSDVSSTTSAPTPPSPPSVPEKGSYNVTHNGTACLLARMGLQLNVTIEGKAFPDIINLQPNVTNTTGTCEADTATLILMEKDTNLTFSFFLNSTTKKYHLGGLALSINLSGMARSLEVSNTSLDYLQGTLGYSYMCRQKLILTVVQNFSLNVFNLQVQPFGVSGNKFGAAEECQPDKDDLLIPIAVGAALAGLVLVVLLAYLVGRKRSHAGYQTI
ncbi:lysosome-associated membrane glycoprotein 1b [Neoarius graeffei]|uniref:lysosome-associated membrane glycoprotein 1b n=1 Tax=Neoarius graeffei TaxID=443677 RepID=UPI00298C9AF0|nr:lysosome-associated membrane glycoprotein 1b [Neoarius graeffei]